MAHITVVEGRRAVVRIDGRTVAVLDAGRHPLPRAGWFGRREVREVDVRRQLLVVAGQELATLDTPGVRVTVAVSWRVADPAAFLEVGPIRSTSCDWAPRSRCATPSRAGRSTS